MERPFLSIVLPFYNEEECVAEVIAEIQATLICSNISFEILAVQNGSKDRTGEILKTLQDQLESLRIIHVPVNKGFGYGLIQGLTSSSGEIVGFMSGDSQINPEVIPLLIEHMKKTHSDIGMGRRIIRHDGWLRWIISWNYNFLARLLFGLSMKDLNSHPKLMTRRAYSLMQLRSHNFFIDPEILLKAKRLGLKVCEVDIEFRRRKTGHSNVKWTTCLEFFIDLCRARFIKKDPLGLNTLMRDK
jgi:glycosyltransferase involved in cell wall biosynthesis